MFSDAKIRPPSARNKNLVNLEGAWFASSPEAFVDPFIRVNFRNILVKRIKCHMCCESPIFVLVDYEAPERWKHVPKFSKGKVSSKFARAEMN
jgi:hypothetical protein